MGGETTGVKREKESEPNPIFAQKLRKETMAKCEQTHVVTWGSGEKVKRKMWGGRGGEDCRRNHKVVSVNLKSVEEKKVFTTKSPTAAPEKTPPLRKKKGRGKMEHTAPATAAKYVWIICPSTRNQDTMEGKELHPWGREDEKET